MLIIIRLIMIMLMMMIIIPMTTYVQQEGEVDLAAGIETTADGSCAVLWQIKSYKTAFCPLTNIILSMTTKLVCHKYHPLTLVIYFADFIAVL